MNLVSLAPAIFVLLWSTGWIVAKYATHVADPLTFLAVRYVVAAGLFFIVCRFADVTWPRGRVALHAVISGIFLHGFYLGAVWWAIGQGVPAAISGIIAGLQPLMTGIGAALLLNERLSRSQQCGLGLGLVGIAIAVLPKLAGTDAAAVPALAVAINVIGMASVSYGTIYQKRNVPSGDLRAVATLQYVGAFIVTLPMAFLFENMHLEWGIGLFATLAWAVIGISMGAMALLLYLIRRGSVSKAASLIYLVPPLAAVEAVIAFGESLTVWMILGTVIAVVGVYLTNRKA